MARALLKVKFQKGIHNQITSGRLFNNIFFLVAKTEYFAQKKAWQKRLKESANILGSYVLQPTQNLFPNTMTLYTIRSRCQLQTKLDSPSESRRDE